MDIDLMRVALRQHAMYLPDVKPVAELKESTVSFMGKLRGIGFTMTERLLHAFNGMTYIRQREAVKVMNDIMGTNLNWSPMVKGWLNSTGETMADKWLAAIVTELDVRHVIPCETMPCGHRIPLGLFHLERYNGCPVCGRQFKTSHYVYRGQGCKLKELDLWTDTDMQKHLMELLESPTPLDATQRDSVKTLLRHYTLPKNVAVGCKETMILIVDELIADDNVGECKRIFTSPVDIMRYLWYKKTGQMQIVQPSVIVSNARRNNMHVSPWLSRGGASAYTMRKRLRLHYSRKQCRIVADWLNAVPMTVEQACEAMHPKREMWVHFIRALRLAEYARREEYAYLRELLDCFYNKRYSVFAGELEQARLDGDAIKAFALLRQRPGIFSRSLFANMLRLGPAAATDIFWKVSDKVPLRLLCTLAMYAEDYFDPEKLRVVKPLGAVQKTITANPLLKKYSDEERKMMVGFVRTIALDALRKHYSEEDDLKGKTVWIDPILQTVPVSIGERAATIQDISCALPGTVFPVDGNYVRLFMQWGKGLHAQHLDMDLSCLFFGKKKQYECTYYDLTVPGAQHSGDIQRIPEMTGTAEYIELDIDELAANGVKYAVFTCNAYSCGNIAPNLVVGWMNAEERMHVSDNTGVAYDPSTVQHAVRVDDSNLSKGLAFGILRVDTRDILWLEMPFYGQLAVGMSFKTLDTLVNKLEARTKIGELLTIRAQEQKATVTDDPNKADVKFDYLWVLDTAKVSSYLLG